jgi:hypothetical protein
LNEALAIDDQHAGLWYEIGQSYDSLGMIEQAREAFIQAKERDVCPLRMLEPMHAALLEIAADADVPLVDVRQRFEAISRWSIPGGDWLVDHVHPSIEGHKKIAEWLLEALVREGLVKPHAGWRERRDRRYRDHLASLDDFYYLRGEQRLRNLRRWAAGRVKLTRPQPTETPAPSSP